MATLQARLDNQDYKNWVKAALCLHLVKEGLEDLADERSKDFHRQVLQDAGGSHSVCHTERISFDNNTGTISCCHPYCQQFVNAISDLGIDLNKRFRFRNNLKNCDVRLWHSEHWELAKIFMNDGQTSVQKTPRDTDLSGIINFLSHCKVAAAAISNIHIISQVRDDRNKVMHTANMQVTEADFKSLSTTLICLLQDPTELLGHKDAQKAVTSINEVIRSDFHITKEDECKVIRNLANDILTRFEALKTDVWAVKQSTDEDRSKLQQEEGQMKMLLASVECLENKVAGDADLNVRIQTSIADLGKARAQIEEILELIQTRITALENKIAEVEQNTNQQMAMVTGEIDALDIKHDSIVTEVNQLKNASTKAQSRISEMETEVDKINARQDYMESVVKSSTNKEIQRGQNEAIITWYEEKDHLFVETKAFHQLKSILEDKYWATIVGKPGDGKSAMAGYLATKYRNEGYEPIFITSAEDWKRSVSCRGVNDQIDKQLIVIDDMFGSSVLDQKKVNEWLALIGYMEKTVEISKGNIRVICTSRRYIFTDVQLILADSKVCKPGYVVDTTGEEYCLSSQEKTEIFKRFAKENNVTDFTAESVRFIDPPHGFPHCVEMFCTNPFLRENGISFFKNPEECIQRQISIFRENDPAKYILLLLMLIRQDTFDYASFDSLIDSPSETEKKLFRAVGLSLDTAIPGLRKALPSLKNTYLRQAYDGSFSFTHESLKENVAFEFFRASPSLAAQTLDLKFILSVPGRFYNADEGKASNFRDIKPLFLRLVEEIKSGNVFEIYSSKIWDNQTFVNHWITYITTDMRGEMKTVLCAVDKDKFPTLRSFDYTLQVCDPFRSAHSVLSSLMYYNRDYAACGILQNPKIQEEMEKISDWIILLHQGLEFACTKNNNCDVITAFLSLKPCGNKLDGTKALLAALSFSKIDYAEMVLQKTQVAPNYQENSRGFFYYLATSNVDVGKMDTVCERLLEIGEDINVKDAGGIVPLFALVHKIIRKGFDFDRISYFVNKGADINVRNTAGQNIVLYTLKHYDAEKCVKFLQKLLRDFNCIDECRKNAMLYVFDYRTKDKAFLELFRYLNSMNVDLCHQDEKGRNSLMLALEHGCDLDIIKQLMLNSPQKHTDADGQGYYHYLCKSSLGADTFSKYCTVLSDNGEDVNLIDSKGDSPLTVRIKHELDSSIITLVEHGAELNAKDKFGRNLIMHMLLWGRYASDILPSLLTQIVQAGAELHILDNDGRNAMHYLFCDGYDYCSWTYKNTEEDYFLENNSIYAWESHQLEKQTDLCVYLKKEGVNPFQNDCDDVNPVMLALRNYPNLECVKDLLNNIQWEVDKEGKTYFHYLAESLASDDKFKEICSELKCRGDINSKDFSGKSPLYACFTSFGYSTFNNFAAKKLKKLEILVECGARADTKEKWEECPVPKYDLPAVRIILQNAGLRFHDEDLVCGWSSIYKYLHVLP